MNKTRFFLVISILALFSSVGEAQKKSAGKYPSLLWEITGNGLKKPSYLFGTMHVSSKMVFHLSDSFYYAIKNTDAVALELNPDVWQGQMVNLDKLKENYSNYVQPPAGSFLRENSFRLKKYDDELKAALSTEPTVVNSLLYRSYKTKEDFEEDTFLDLYIFQTGRKLGKRATGVENYYDAERIMLEAYADMAKEKKKKTVDTDGESMSDILEKTEDAYKRGDLDLMDSLDLMTERSDVFREKFLYKRNEIQANSMDTIMKNSSLFVGVGAAHLPGKRGVIELLRKKGYTLRPIFMADRDAAQKDSIDKARVPVNFTTQHADDNFYSVAMPGPLFKMNDDYQVLDRRQYSDMSNGSYYLVTRLKTHGGFLGQKKEDVLKKVDSALYENIPGKILTKKNITVSGYPGYDITNKTRRGDLQRYNIFATPYEIIIFKMSGKENYVNGKEADQFFSSIKLKQLNEQPVTFEPEQGGFSVQMPQQPSAYLNTITNDGTDRWEYEATDKATGNAYLVMKKSIYNFNYLDQDTFYLSMMEESFRNPDFFDKQLSRAQTTFNGYPCLDVKERMKDGSEVTAKYIINGPHYYLIAAKSNDKKADLKPFFESFKFTPYRYSKEAMYVDTFMHFSVSTSVTPEFDEQLRATIERSADDIAANAYSGYTPYWPKPRTGLFVNDSTGERVAVNIQKYPQYFSARDTAKFWKNTIEDVYDEHDLVLHDKQFFKLDNGVQGYRFNLTDTGSSRMISRLVMLKDNYIYGLATITDTINKQHDFADNFFRTFKPEANRTAYNIFESRLDQFFTDLFSKDSATHTRAQQFISNLYFGEKGGPKIINAIERLSIKDKDYFSTKTKLIAELGYIKDTTKPFVAAELKKLYEQTADTSIFQNEVLTALAQHKTKASYDILKELILQDPPVFENEYGYTQLFKKLDDSLQLAKSLFPEILQLASLDDYKESVTSLLVQLVDSNLVKADEYESYFAKIYFDAKIELRKQQAKDEKLMQEESKEDNNEDLVYSIKKYAYKYKANGGSLDKYSVLLMPFYEKNNNVKKFFDKLLLSKDPDVRLNTAVLLLHANKTVADSVLDFFAAKDKYRAGLYTRLKDAGRLDKFPVKYKSQLLIARSLLAMDKGYDKIDSIVFLTKQPAAYKNTNGVVYFFKYRINNTDDWKIGVGGLQPLNEKEIDDDDDLVVMTDKKLKTNEPQNDQLQAQLKRLLFVSHKSGQRFFSDNDSYRNYFNKDYDN